jgi:hypothetical protein
MNTKTKTKLALLAFARATKQLITNPLRFAVSIFDTLITPFAQYEQEVQKTSSIPEELKFAYQRDWTYTTLSDIRAEAGRKGGSKN